MSEEVKNENLGGLLKTRLNQYKMLSNTVVECIERGGPDMTVVTLEGEMADLLDEIKSIRRDILEASTEKSEKPIVRDDAKSAECGEFETKCGKEGCCSGTRIPIDYFAKNTEDVSNAKRNDATNIPSDVCERLDDRFIRNDRFLLGFNDKKYHKAGASVNGFHVDRENRRMTVVMKNSLVKTLTDPNNPNSEVLRPLTHVFKKGAELWSGIDVLYISNEETPLCRELYADAVVESVETEPFNYDDDNMNKVAVTFRYKACLLY